jgi:hypothetical protein
VIGVELLTTRTSAGRYAILRIVVRHRSTQIGAKLTHSPSQAFAQEHAQRVPATVTNLGGDSFNIQPATGLVEAGLWVALPKSGASHQVVVASALSRSPASAKMNVPIQEPAILAPSSYHFLSCTFA